MNIKTPKFGFTAFSEKLNGQMAMMGIIGVILFEILTKEKILDFFL